MGEITTSEKESNDVPIADTAPRETDNLTDVLNKDENLLEQYDQQLREIELETKQDPLVGTKLPFGILLSQYNPNDSAEFYIKAMELSETYGTIRPIRRDGNCFYRSILVAEIEQIFANPDEMKRFDSVCRGWKDRLLKLGFNDFTTTDFCDTFYEFLDGISKGETNLESALEILNKDEYSNYLLIFLRLVTSGYLKEHTDEYAPFIDGDRSLTEFCEQEIEPMWKDVDHLAITALVAAIGVNIRVEYMDQSAAPNGGWHYDFPPEQTSVPNTVLLYRPGHYDVIYRK